MLKQHLKILFDYFLFCTITNIAEYDATSIKNNRFVNKQTKYVKLSLLILFMYFCNPKMFLNND